MKYKMDQHPEPPAVSCALSLKQKFCYVLPKTHILHIL